MATEKREILAEQVERLTANLRTIDAELDNAAAPFGPDDESGVYTRDSRVIALGLALTAARAEIAKLTAELAEKDATMAVMRTTGSPWLGALGALAGQPVVPVRTLKHWSVPPEIAVNDIKAHRSGGADPNGGGQ